MINESTIKLTISVAGTELDDEKLDDITRSLMWDIKDLDLAEDISLAKSHEAAGDIHRGNLVTTVLGVLNAEVDITKIGKFLGFLSDRLSSKPIKITVKTPDGKEYIIEAGNIKQLEAATQTILALLGNT
jgi:hypothetical protein